MISYLYILQEQYAMCPIEKAANNIAFACKKYYDQVLLKELDLLNTTSNTYHLAPFNVLMLHYFMWHYFHVALVVVALFNFLLFWYFAIKFCTIFVTPCQCCTSWMLHYLLFYHLILYYINTALFYFALLMLDYFNFALFGVALVGAVPFTVALLNVVLF